MHAIAIVQARMGSTRLPGKVLADLCGKPLIDRVIERVQATARIERVVVATTTDAADDVLANWCTDRGVPVFRGSSEDVLDRFWGCAQEHKSELIVRVTADDPLKDPEIITRALELCEESTDVDYASNTLQPTFPEGLDIEVLRYRALECAARQATLRSEREHVTPYIWKHPERFVLRSFVMQPDLSHWRWTVDKPSDLDLLRHIFSQFQDQPLVGHQEVISWLQEHPELLRINTGTLRNEGYLKTISEDKAP